MAPWVYVRFRGDPGVSLHGDLPAQARHLATCEPQRPRQASLPRALSSAYYAVFHLLIAESTSLLSNGSRRALLCVVVSNADEVGDSQSPAILHSVETRNGVPGSRAAAEGAGEPGSCPARHGPGSNAVALSQSARPVAR